MDEPRRPRGRPKGTGKVHPDDIIAAAVDALATGGYKALSMRGIARTLGVSLSTVQHHYPTKDALWRAAVDRLAATTIDRQRSTDLHDVAGSIATELEKHRHQPGLVMALLSDTDEGSSERIDYLAKRFSTMLARPAQELDELEQQGLMRPVNADALFALMAIGIGAIAGAAPSLEVIFGYDVTTDTGRKEFANDLADILVLGLRPR
ncbi:MAG: TetR/AcrR family transcriptional regulator [Actinomycetota bacterium]